MKSYKKRLRDWIERRLGISVFRSSDLPHGLLLTRDLPRFGITPEVVFDVGAHVGVKSIEYDNAWPDAEIFSFEPIESTFKQLKQNTAGRRVNVHNFGLGDEAREMTVNLHERSNLNSIVVKKEKGSGGENIKIKTIDVFCRENNINKIDLLKIDTEGYDLKVLKGGEGMLKDESVNSILVEVGFGSEKKRHVNLEKITNFLSNYDLKLAGFYDQVVNYDSNRFRFANALFVA